ncbi:hypothetical protein D9M71_806960 [compost metagenome]
MIEPVRQIEQVVAFGELPHYPLNVSARQFLLELHTRLWRLLARNLDGLQVQITRRARQAFHRDAAHGNFFHQLLVVCVQRIEAVNLVVRGLVGGRVAQHHQRLELLQ